MAQAGEYPTGLFGCLSVKNCGVGCCVKNYFCLACNYASAIEAAELGSCAPCCIAMYVLPCCTGIYNRGKLAEKYNINEPMTSAAVKYCCCTVCAVIQDVNLVLVKENKTWGCPSVANGAPPATETMER